MSRTVSFRCSEELDEFLEQEAERRMTTKSTAAQMILAEYARESGKVGDTSEGGNDASEGVSGGETDILDKYDDQWWEVDEKRANYRIRMPSDHDGAAHQDRKTLDGVRSVLEKWYE